jgi:hypothetical protein
MNFEPTEGKDFLDSYLENKDFFIFSLITDDFVDLAINWFLHLKKLNLNENCFLVCLNHNAYLKLKHINIPCIFYKTDISFQNIEQEETGKIKYEIAYFLYSHYKKDAIHSDVDIVFLKNPIDELKKQSENYDLLGINNQNFKPIAFINNKDYELNIEKGWEYNDFFNFCYFPYNEKNITIANVAKNKMNILAQKVLAKTKQIDIYSQLDLKIKLLNPLYFSNWSYIKHNSIKNKIFENSYLVHYNFMDYDELPEIQNLYKDTIFPKNENELIEKMLYKIILMKKNNHWLL